MLCLESSYFWSGTWQGWAVGLEWNLSVGTLPASRISSHKKTAAAGAHLQCSASVPAFWMLSWELALRIDLGGKSNKNYRTCCTHTAPVHACLLVWDYPKWLCQCRVLAVSRILGGGLLPKVLQQAGMDSRPISILLVLGRGLALWVLQRGKKVGWEICFLGFSTSSNVLNPCSLVVCFSSAWLIGWWSWWLLLPAAESCKFCLMCWCVLSYSKHRNTPLCSYREMSAQFVSLPSFPLVQLCVDSWTLKTAWESQH